MPMSLVYLLIMLAVICVWFILLKRPIWESMAISFLVLVAVTNTWSHLWTYVDTGLSTSLLYSMVVFIAMSAIMTKTHIIDGAVNIILALLVERYSYIVPLSKVLSLDSLYFVKFCSDIGLKLIIPYISD